MSVLPSVYQFGRFTLQPSERRLLSDARVVSIGPRAFDLLVALVRREGQLATKDELLAEVWRGLIVEESNLHVQVSTLRKLLGAKAIETIARNGYRFSEVVRHCTVPKSNESGGNRLPRPPTNFVGREIELARLLSLFESTRLLTLTGIGGTGKTRLAIRLAESLLPALPDGAWFVDLAPLSDATQLVATIVDTVGPPKSESRETAGSLASQLAETVGLIVLDNCEHLAATCAHVVEDLLDRTAHLKVLTTSREPLDLPGEVQWPVPPLSLSATHLSSAFASDAIALFVSRAKTTNPDLAWDEGQLRLADAICRRLDGIPLAIELAAAHARILSLAEIETLLGDRFSLLVRRSGANGSPRQRTLEEVIRWSYEQLDEYDRRLLRRCAVFAGGWDLEGAVAVAGGEGECAKAAVARQLSTLSDYSLIRIEQRGTAPTRYSMLETLRQFAAERLSEAGEFDDAHKRHFLHFLAFSERISTDSRAFSGYDNRSTFNQHDLERENLSIACAWSDGTLQGDEMVLRINNVVHGYWCELSYLLDAPKLEYDPLEHAARLLNAAISRCRGRTRSGDYCRALRGAAFVAHARGRPEALELLDESLEIARELGDKERISNRLGFRTFILLRQRRYEEGYESAREGLTVALSMGDDLPVVYALFGISSSLLLLGRVSEAEDAARRALALARRTGSTRAITYSLDHLLSTAIVRCDFVEGFRLFKEFMSSASGLDDRRRVGDILGISAWAAAVREEWALSARLDAAANLLPNPIPEHPVDLACQALQERAREALGEDRYIAERRTVASIQAALAEAQAWIQAA